MQTHWHHLHQRKRGARHLEPYPSPNKFFRILDRVAFANGIFGALASSPQLYLIISTGKTEGISLVMWALFAVSSSVWILYGWAHRAPPIIASSLISLCLSIAIISAVVLA